MHNCPKDNGKAQNENRSDVNYWCFLGNCVVVMRTILFVLIVFWFCLVVLCYPLLQFAECSQRKETTWKPVGLVKRHFIVCLTALKSYFVPTATLEIKQRECGQTLGFPLMRNRYSSLYLIPWKFSIAPPGHCVHVPLQGWADARILRVDAFCCWPIAIISKEVIG